MEVWRYDDDDDDDNDWVGGHKKVGSSQCSHRNGG
jgi:hypothetical protein